MIDNVSLFILEMLLLSFFRFEKVLSLLDSVHQAVSVFSFYNTIWLCIIDHAGVRASALNFLARRLNVFPSLEGNRP